MPIFPKISSTPLKANICENGVLSLKKTIQEHRRNKFDENIIAVMSLYSDYYREVFGILTSHVEF